MKNVLTGKYFLIALIVLLFPAAGTIHAQKDQAEKIAKIRQIYTQTNDRIAAANGNFPESDVFFSELIVNKGGTMYPAVGIFKSVFSFYYTYGDREIDPYPNRLLKVVVTTDRSARREYSEYLFDAASELIFCFEKMDDEPESRYYFSGGKILRIMRGDKVLNTKSREESDERKSVQSQADRIVQIFRNSIN